MPSIFNTFPKTYLIMERFILFSLSQDVGDIAKALMSGNDQNAVADLYHVMTAGDDDFAFSVYRGNEHIVF